MPTRARTCWACWTLSRLRIETVPVSGRVRQASMRAGTALLIDGFAQFAVFIRLIQIEEFLHQLLFAIFGMGPPGGSLLVPPPFARAFAMRAPLLVILQAR